MDIRFFGGDEQDGRVFVVETKAAAGLTLESHQHSHAHTSVLVSGKARVTIDGAVQELDGYQILTVPANTQHKVEAITDIVWLCLWADDVAPRGQAEQSVKMAEDFNARAD
jgi:quercetin dioxygenase-like cupin family protein